MLETPLGSFLPQLKHTKFLRTALVISRWIAALLGVLILTLTLAISLIPFKIIVNNAQLVWVITQ